MSAEEQAGIGKNASKETLWAEIRHRDSELVSVRALLGKLEASNEQLDDVIVQLRARLAVADAALASEREVSERHCADAVKLDAALAAAVSKAQLNLAVNRSCSCGGRPPGTPSTCPACEVWHRLFGDLAPPKPVPIDAALHPAPKEGK